MVFVQISRRAPKPLTTCDVSSFFVWRRIIYTILKDKYVINNILSMTSIYSRLLFLLVKPQTQNLKKEESVVLTKV